MVLTFEGLGTADSGGLLAHGKTTEDGQYVCLFWRKFLKLPANGTYRLTVNVRKVKKGGAR